MDQAKARSGWTTCNARAQKITSMIVDITAGHNTTVDTMKMCPLRVLLVSEHEFTMDPESLLQLLRVLTLYQSMHANFYMIVTANGAPQLVIR